jgi:hypothetical protein
LSDDQGYIYILSNPAFKDGLYKIGMTTRSADSRAWEIFTGATGVPAPFKVEYTFPVSRCTLAEREVHNELHRHRYNTNREFFEVSKKLARQTIATIGTKINEQYGEPSPPKIDKEDWNIQTEGEVAVTPEQVTTDKPLIVVKSYSRKHHAPQGGNAPSEPLVRDGTSRTAFPIPHVHAMASGQETDQHKTPPSEITDNASKSTLGEPAITDPRSEQAEKRTRVPGDPAFWGVMLFFFGLPLLVLGFSVLLEGGEALLTIPIFAGGAYITFKFIQALRG